MSSYILQALTIGPPLLFLWLIYLLDKKEKEPKRLIFKLFALGAAIAIPIAFVEILLENFNPYEFDSIGYHFVDAFLIVALCEELGKFLCVKLVTWKSKYFDYRYDAIVYAVAVSLGFATLENITYVFAEDNGIIIAIMRMLLSVPGHLMFAVSMGLFYGPMKLADNRRNKVAKIFFGILALAVPIALHGFYDFCLFVGNVGSILIFFAFVLLVDIVGIVITLLASKKDKMIIEPEIKQDVNYSDIE